MPKLSWQMRLNDLCPRGRLKLTILKQDNLPVPLIDARRHRPTHMIRSMMDQVVLEIFGAGVVVELVDELAGQES